MLDQRVSTQAVLAEVLWLQGFADQAMRMTERNIAEAFEVDHAMSLCDALAKACFVALYVGDLEALERYASILLDHSAHSALESWHAEAHCFLRILGVRRGEGTEQSQVLRSALDELRKIKFALRYSWLLSELAELLGRGGEVAQGLAAIDEALARSERNEEHWCMAELLRVKGELLLLEGAIQASQAAERLFEQALEWARDQAVLAWELRCTMSQARLWAKIGKAGVARELLSEVYGRFTEGFSTVDLVAARVLIDELQ